jgi:hypothetical protein
MEFKEAFLIEIQKLVDAWPHKSKNATAKIMQNITKSYTNMIDCCVIEKGEDATIEAFQNFVKSLPAQDKPIYACTFHELAFQYFASLVQTLTDKKTFDRFIKKAPGSDIHLLLIQSFFFANVMLQDIPFDFKTFRRIYNLAKPALSQCEFMEWFNSQIEICKLLGLIDFTNESVQKVQFTKYSPIPQTHGKGQNNKKRTFDETQGNVSGADCCIS